MATGLAGRRVLIVEDEYFIADDLAEAVERTGATVLGPVGAQDDALALLARDRPDVAILDVNLKGDVSFAIADELSKRGVPFVFATGYDSGMIPERYRDVLRWEKPFEPAGLVAALSATAP